MIICYVFEVVSGIAKIKLPGNRSPETRVRFIRLLFRAQVLSVDYLVLSGF
jgi:hypothetical protein